ncbi:hypothetical protein GCM10009548_16490 [Streptomyces malaysiensis subsp. malaysiensis]
MAMTPVHNPASAATAAIAAFTFMRPGYAGGETPPQPCDDPLGQTLPRVHRGVGIGSLRTFRQAGVTRASRGVRCREFTRESAVINARCRKRTRFGRSVEVWGPRGHEPRRSARNLSEIVTESQ